MPYVILGYRETKGLRHLLWIRLCQAIDIHIIWVVIDSCHSKCTGINKIYILNPTVVAKLLQYSGSRVEHKDEFSLYK